MKFSLFLTVLSLLFFHSVRGQAFQVGDTVPDYIFQEVLNGDQKPILYYPERLVAPTVIMNHLGQKTETKPLQKTFFPQVSTTPGEEP